MNRAELAAQLNIDEGRRTRLYVDTVGKTTGGVGHNFDDKGIPEKVIDLLLDIDIADAERDLDRALPWWRNLSDVRQQALCNMCFNLGITRLLQFKITLASLHQGRFSDAASEMLNSKWAVQVGARAKRLSDMIRNG